MYASRRRVRHDSHVSEATKSVWVDIRTTQQVVATGFRTILEQAVGPFEITLDTPAAGHEPDIVLYDVIKLNEGDGSDLEHLLKDTVSTVIAIDRTLKPELGTRAKEKGVEWAITLDIAPDDLVAVIYDAASGLLDESNVAQEWDPTEFLGAAEGLSPRESASCSWSCWGTATRRSPTPSSSASTR